jgi:hypothetical protein
MHVSHNHQNCTQPEPNAANLCSESSEQRVYEVKLSGELAQAEFVDEKFHDHQSGKYHREGE